jgi:hypothetical protein
LRLIAIAAVHRTVAARLKRHRRLLAASGTNHRCASRLSSLVSAAPATAPLLVLLCLTARFAALGRGVPALLEERLVFARKGEFLPAVATSELLIASHGESSFPLYVIILYFRGFRKPPAEIFLLTAPGRFSTQSPVPEYPVSRGLSEPV